MSKVTWCVLLAASRFKTKKLKLMRNFSSFSSLKTDPSQKKKIFDFPLRHDLLKNNSLKVKEFGASGIPVVHHEKYVCEFPIKHRFCMRKFHGVMHQLCHDNIIQQNQVVEPELITQQLCELVHDSDYIHRFFNGLTSEKEQKICGFMWSPGIVSRCRYETGGTLLACQLALERGVACSTGGGTHHAYASHGSGYCLINDMAIAAAAMIHYKAVRKVLILDLDVHQGDGTASIMGDNQDVFTLSIHCQSNFPFQKQSSDLDIGLADHIGVGQGLS